MAGYAVTFEGATKLLYQLGLVGLGGPIDNEICRIVQSSEAPLFPPSPDQLLSHPKMLTMRLHRLFRRSRYNAAVICAI